MENIEIITRLWFILILSSILWIEREVRHQPAGLRTHILIWVWSALLMILSMKVAELPGYMNGDPGRIAAQVVTGIWFIWAWAIMRMWLNTKWLTTAANIWVTSAIWLTVWAWFYFIATIATLLILFNLTIIVRIKKRFIHQYRYCKIEIEIKNLSKNNQLIAEKKIHEKFENIPMKIITKDIIENNNTMTIKILTKINKKIKIYKILHALKKFDKKMKISIQENIQ